MKTVRFVFTRAAWPLIFILMIFDAADGFSLTVDKLPQPIVPQPKTIDVLGGVFAIDKNTVIVTKPSMDIKTGIGLEKINQKCQSLFGYSLTAIEYSSGCEANYEKIIFIGNPLEEPWLNNHCEMLDCRFDADTLGEQGYIIRFHTIKNKEVICVFGANPQGLLYGCMTLCELFISNGKTPGLLRADIFDKPDFKYRMNENLKIYYVNSQSHAKKVIDFALKHKINMIWSGFDLEKHGALETDKNWFKNINQYAWDRGIRIVYSSWWNIGKAPIPPGASPLYYPYEDMIGHHGMLFCWNNDERLENKCLKLKKFVQEIQPKALFFHSIDTGGVENPERWKNRCNRTKERFGNDRATADAHIINTLYAAVKDVDPEIMFITTVYPYFAYHLRHEEVQNWLSMLSQEIPSDAYICIREDSRENIRKWKQSVWQPICLYHESEKNDWKIHRPSITSFRFAKTFYFENSSDVYWYTVGSPFDIVKILGHAEYSWNTGKEGADFLQSFEIMPSWKQATQHSSAVSGSFVPKVSKVIFGGAYQEMSQVINYNLSPYLMVKPEVWVDKDYCEQQFENSKKSLALLQIAKYKIKNPNLYFKVFAAHCLACRYFSEARLNIMAARELLNNGDHERAQEKITKSLQIIHDGELEFMGYTAGEKRIYLLNYEELKSIMIAELAKLNEFE